MSLIVETGAGSTTSESYASVANSLSYHDARGNATWSTITTAQQEQALRRATDYIEQVYSQQWQGTRITNTQALSFPRNAVYFNGFVISGTTIPQLLINATCELALKAASGDLSPDMERAVSSEKVGVLEVQYEQYSSQIKRFTSIDNMLRPLLQRSSNATVGIIRA